MATKTTRTFDLKTVQTVAERPFYASVGITDLAVEAVREYVSDVQSRVRGYGQDVQRNVGSLELPTLQPRALRDSAVTAVTGRVDALSKDAKQVPAVVGATYGDLVKRGESLVGRIRGQKSTQDTVKAAGTTATKAKTTKTQAAASGKATAKKASGTAKKRSTAPKRSAKATATSAKQTASSASRALSDGAAKVGD